MHELLEAHFKGIDPVPSTNPEVEDEAQGMIERYIAHYPEEEFDVVEIERTFCIPIPGTSHEYTGKFDGIVRARGSARTLSPGRLYILEHKTEKRGANTNSPLAWAARAQVGLYKWAAQQIYGEPIEGIILDVLTRQSPKGLCPPEFRRDLLQRTDEQITEALVNIVWVADSIERMEKEFPVGMWPADREQCMKGYFRCDFYELHVVGRSEFVLLRDFQPAEKYLDL